MGVTVAVAGASGYAGGELLRLLIGHPEVELGALAAGSSAGRRVTDVHPHLLPLSGRTFEATGGGLDADVVFLALPHGASAAVADALPTSARVIDLGADHRLTSPEDWAAGYGGAYADPWPYGLPELPGAREQIARATRVAAPGCYPTATILGLAPLITDGLVAPDDIVVVAASGTSGAGRAPKEHLLASQVMGDLWAYKVGGHQHRFEIAQALGIASLSFTPVLAPLPRGLLATCTARLVDPGTTTDQLRSALEKAYGHEAFVHLLAEDDWPHAAAVNGSNACQLQVTADPATGRAAVVSVIDNLGKGAAGQAVQCMNLMLGLPETTGLSVCGVAP
ncbi:MAG TPA: N-acetyl-gamma-glutamyl-phosphate reductase [Frankiaceae bacterium]|nr:N-acetyl-gamma-glutamyl-phosphate reductase [Frankiaceae bacterium]